MCTVFSHKCTPLQVIWPTSSLKWGSFPRLLFCCTTCYFLLSKNIFLSFFYFKLFNLTVYFFPTSVSAVVPIVKGIQTYGFFFIPPNFFEKKTRNIFLFPACLSFYLLLSKPLILSFFHLRQVFIPPVCGCHTRV